SPARLSATRPDAATRDFRDRAREAEAVVAETFLWRLLPPAAADGPRTADRPRTAAGWAARLAIADEHLPVLRLWLDWLTGRGALVREGAAYAPATAGGYAPAPAGKPAPGPAGDSAPRQAPGHRAYGDLTARAGERLLARLDDYRDILAGRALPALLLDDDVLAPDRLSAADPGSDKALDALAARIADHAAKLGRPVEMVQLGAGAGTTAARLLTRLTPDQVRPTLTDTDPDLLARAEQRLSALPHRPVLRRLSGVLVPEEMRHRFDIVLADQYLHRGADPAQGPALAGALARPGGLLLAAERSELTPVALLTAALLDGGYASFDPRRRAAGTPVLAPDRWAELLGAAGFEEVGHTPVPGSFTELIEAVRPDDAVDPDPARLRALAAERLPAHMVPEPIAVLTRLPLGANGKLDRTALAELVGATEENDPDEPPRGALEESLAALWTALLGVSAVGRRQSFFALGGDSLLATRFLAAVKREFGADLPLRALFAGPTLEQAAGAVAAL
ncbi:phosphopantetheine-binding protein, partial [Streptomyces sp. NPDC057654]|uniref:phosphopantetheine-binding protein n=1 Tax=Streptomyces sp. NPDC057654 TaxID=3346196 RepID=UPI0036C606F5